MDKILFAKQTLEEISAGFIYVIKIDKYYKIGKTLNPNSRITEFTQLFEEPSIIVLKKVGNYSDVEKILHEKFKQKRVRGEWFVLAQKDIDYIKTFLDNYICESQYKEKAKYFESEKINIKQRFTKIMDKEKEIVDKLIKFPSTYIALSIMRHYIMADCNLLVKDGKKYKCVDLAQDMNITRQMAAKHIAKLKQENILSEIETNKGKLMVLNPYYYFKGDEVPKLVLDAFDKPIKD